MTRLSSLGDSLSITEFLSVHIIPLFCDGKNVLQLEDIEVFSNKKGSGNGAETEW